MCLVQEVQHEAAVLPGSGGRVHTVEDYFLLILGAQRPLATLAAPQKPFKASAGCCGGYNHSTPSGSYHELSHDPPGHAP